MTLGSTRQSLWACVPGTVRELIVVIVLYGTLGVIAWKLSVWLGFFGN